MHDNLELRSKGNQVHVKFYARYGIQLLKLRPQIQLKKIKREKEQTNKRKKCKIYTSVFDASKNGRKC